MKITITKLLPVVVLLLRRDCSPHRVDRYRRIIDGYTPKVSEGHDGANYYGLVYWEYELFPPGYQNFQKSLCGAVVIDKNHFLSAAHCIYQYHHYVKALQKENTVNSLFGARKFEAKVYFGNFTQSLGEFDKGGFSEKLDSYAINIEDIDVHEDYVNNNTHFLNDIAVIKIDGSFDPERILRMCNSADKKESTMLIASGTGLTQSGIPTTELKSVEVEETDGNFCDGSDPLRTDPGSYICTKGELLCFPSRQVIEQQKLINA